MKIFRKLASLVIAATMITSSTAFVISANAAETADAPQAANDSALQSEVKDGVILHAFNWSYNSIKENLPAIAAAGYTTVQTSPVQQAKDYGSSNDVVGQWWKLYQPVSMQIAEKSWLGTKEDLRSLCAEADKYGVKIICDIVSNHMGNETEQNPNSLSPLIQTYQPDFYNNKSTYFRSNSISANDNSIQNVVQGHVSSCPDLNTGNKNVQDAVIALLKDCIDCGVDGFRFDAAKHIETPDDGEYKSDYWPNITSSAGNYYKQKTGGNLYIYGEVLNTCGAGRKYSSYTDYISITDNTTGDSVLSNVRNGNAASAASPTYKSGVSASKAVLWAESHDTYLGSTGNTSKVSDENIVKAWAIVASRKDSTALYFVRPGTALMGEAGTDTTYKSTAVSEINKFHNLFVGQSEKLGSSDGVAYVARGTSGIVLSNCSGTTKNVSISDTGLANGTYTDTITGNTFTVSNGVLSGSIGSTGVAVVYDGSTTPRNTNSVESGSFNGETLTLTLGLENATSGTYCLDDSTPVTYTGTTTIRIGSDYNYGDTINLTLTATDGKKETSAVYKYTKNESDSSGVYIFIDPSTRSNWQSPFNIYIYDEDTSSSMTFANASWPGQPMQYDEATGYWYYEVPSKTCLGTDKDEKGNTIGDPYETIFNLAKSANSCVIISDSGNVSSAPRQYPGQTSKVKLKIGGSSKLLGNPNSSSWVDTTLVPSSGSNQPATNVTKGTAAEPTTTVKPTTAVPTTTVKPTTPVPTTTGPVGERLYGNVDGDERISIFDATLIQKHAVDIELISEENQVLADVDQDGRITVMDATAIQKYLVSLPDCGITGQVYNSPTPSTSPTGAAPTTTAEPETTVEPETTAETEPDTTMAPKPTDPELTKDYYLFGYINGADYGCEGDYQNLGEYKFVNGKVTTNFTQTSYVAVKTGDNKDWFMTDGYQGEVTEVTLYNTTTIGEDADKLMIPAGQCELTLVENGDGTLTLSYEVISGPQPTDPQPTDPELTKDYYLFGYINGANYGCEEDYQNLGEYKFVNGKVTTNFTQTSYVAVKTGDNKEWYMTDGYQGDVTEVTLYNTDNLGVDADKLLIPAGQCELTLVENGNGTLTLSYEVISGPQPTDPQPTDPELTKDYYLFGYINGADYGCEADYQNLGEYKFVNGKVTTNFTQVSYVAVKTGDNKDWFMTDGYQGDVTEVTLYNTTTIGEDADKLKIPAGQCELTLVENGDGTLTLSYEVISDPQPTDPQPTGPNPSTYTFYFKTQLGWMTSDGVSVYVYDTKTGESYLLKQDTSAWPYVYTAEVPGTLTSCIVYRNTTKVTETPVKIDEDKGTGNVYNCWSGTVSSTNNCFTLSTNETTVTTGPYVAEQQPDFELSRVYFDNSNAKWSNVYIYGWGESGLNNTAVKMTQISGTNIWYYDFDEPLKTGSTCFLFKDTAGSGSSDWKNQTNNVTVTDGMNCYRANAGSKSGGSWYSYSE